MKKGRFLWILLIFSLLANVFLVGGALYSRHAGDWRHHEFGHSYIAHELDLSSSQEAELRRLGEQMSSLRDARRSEGGDNRSEMFNLLMEPEFDEARMRALIVERNEQRVEQFLEMGRMMHGFLAGLSPEQRGEAREMMEDRSFWRHLFDRGDRRRGHG